MKNHQTFNNLCVPPASNAPEFARITFPEAMNCLREKVLWIEVSDRSRLVCLFANDAFLEKVGYIDKEIVGRPLDEFVHADSHESLKALIERLKLDSGSGFGLNNMMNLSFHDGKGKWVELSCYVYVCTLKDVRYALIFCTDTDQPFSAYYRSSQLYEEALDGIFTLHRCGEIRNGNKKIEQFIGQREGELTIEFFNRFLPKKKALGLIKFLKHCLKGDMESYPYYISITSGDGKEKHYSVRTIKSPLTDSEVIVYIRDVSNVKRLENDLRESENMYRSVVEQSRDIIWVSLRDKVILANSVAYKLLGDQLRYEEINWKDYAQKIVPEDRDRTVAFLKSAYNNLVEGSGTGSMSTEFKLEVRNGVVLDMVLTVSAITFQRQKALFCTLRDVTESKVLEDKTKESIKLGTLAQFAASVAHEIRNPLEALTSAGLLLSRDLRLEGESKQLMDVILNATGDINSVINEFVSMTSRPVYDFSETHVKTLMESVIKNVKRLKSYHSGVFITASYQRNLPIIHCDYSQLHITLCNVIHNSVSAISDKGTIEIRAEKVLHNSRDAVRIIIKDSGKGISADLLPQIWEPFITSKKKGMGLGLFIAKHCIEDHGGQIDIPSSDERGTVVRIILPILPQGTR